MNFSIANHIQKEYLNMFQNRNKLVGEIGAKLVTDGIRYWDVMSLPYNKY